MQEMACPDKQDHPRQHGKKVMFVSFDIVTDEQGSTFAEKISGKSKNYRPTESTCQVQPEKPGRRERGHTENDGKYDPESVRVPGGKRDKVAVAVDEPKPFSELFDQVMGVCEEILPLQPAEIKIELITAERSEKSGQHHSRDREIPLKRKETGEDESGLPFEKGPEKQHPIAVNRKILTQKILHSASAIPDASQG
jgi:hypothetical protein